MHQVKVFDDSDNLKSDFNRAMQKRSDRLIKTPSLVKKPGRSSKPPVTVKKPAHTDQYF